LPLSTREGLTGFRCVARRRQKELFAELTTLIQAHAPQLLGQRSIGTVTAAVIIGRTAGAQRFRSEACFARDTGTAPIPASSGKTTRHRLHRGGDRQLNRAIHIIALGRVAWDPGDPRLYRTPGLRRKDQTRSDPLPQATHRQTDLEPPLQPLTHHSRPNPATTRTHRRRGLYDPAAGPAGGSGPARRR
jgi:transposase